MNTTSMKGFSLLETVVYIGILAIVAGVFTGIFQSVIKTQLSQTTQNQVTSELQFSMQTMQRAIKESAVIDFEECGATTTLSLTMESEAKSPTTLYTQNGTLYMREGLESPQAITSKSVSVDSLEFKKYCNAGAKDTIEILIAISKTEPSTNKKISQSLQSAVSRVNAATFDSSLLPPTDNTYDIGSPSLRWKNGYFSNQVTAGSLCIGSNCKTSWSEVSQKSQYFIIERPSTSEDDAIFVFQNAATIQKVYAVNKTNGDTVTFNLFHHTSRATATSSASALFSSYQTNTAYTTPTAYTSFSDATVDAGGVLRFVTSAASSTQFLLTIYYTD